MSGQPSALTGTQARRLTEQIQNAIEHLAELVQEAFTRKAHVALGYGTWEAYCQEELPRLRIDRKERVVMGVQLTAAGMSTRQVGAAVGAHFTTIAADLRSREAVGNPTVRHPRRRGAAHAVNEPHPSDAPHLSSNEPSNDPDTQYADDFRHPDEQAEGDQAGSSDREAPQDEPDARSGSCHGQDRTPIADAVQAISNSADTIEQTLRDLSNIVLSDEDRTILLSAITRLMQWTCTVGFRIEEGKTDWKLFADLGSADGNTRPWSVAPEARSA